MALDGLILNKKWCTPRKVNLQTIILEISFADRKQLSVVGLGWGGGGEVDRQMDKMYFAI